jgi:hypothetical protein
MAAEVRLERVPLAGRYLPKNPIIDDRIIRFHIGASKSVDRLFGITHNKKLARFEPDTSPIRLLHTGRFS